MMCVKSFNISSPCGNTIKLTSVLSQDVIMKMEIAPLHKLSRICPLYEKAILIWFSKLDENLKVGNAHIPCWEQA